METVREPLTPEELEALKDSLLYHMFDDGSELMKEFADIEVGAENIRKYSEQRLVVKFYEKGRLQGILCFDVGTSWWTDKTIISEVLILSMSGVHGLQREAIKAMDTLAKEYGADLIASGCIFQKQPQIVTNGYLKAGFTTTCPTYVKVVDHDNR
jgi:hypothetical protein